MEDDASAETVARIGCSRQRPAAHLECSPAGNRLFAKSARAEDGEEVLEELVREERVEERVEAGVDGEEEDEQELRLSDVDEREAERCCGR